MNAVETTLPNGTRLHALLPAGASRGVVVIHEIFGRQPEIDRVVERLAAQGYAVAAPDLFTRGRFRCLRKVMETLRTGKGESVEDVFAARDWLVSHGVPSGKIGVIGFCLGGGFALACGPGFGAVSANYGDVPAAEVMRGSGPVIACYGGRDPMFRGKVPILERRLSRANVEHQIDLYPTVGHSFLTDGSHPVASRLANPLLGTRRQDPQIREEAWTQILAFFSLHL